MNSVVCVVAARADVQAAEVGRDAVAARRERDACGPGADLRVGPADDQQRVLAGPGQVGDAELALALVLPAAPAAEDVPEPVLRLRLFEGRVGDQVFPGGCQVNGQDQQSDQHTGGEKVE